MLPLGVVAQEKLVTLQKGQGAEASRITPDLAILPSCFMQNLLDMLTSAT